MGSKDTSWEIQVEPPSSGEDSDENQSASKRAFPSVRRVVSEISDSKMYITITDEYANELMNQYLIPVNLMFMNLNDDFKKKSYMKAPNQRGRKGSRNRGGQEKEVNEAQNFKKFADNILEKM